MMINKGMISRVLILGIVIISAGCTTTPSKHGATKNGRFDQLLPRFCPDADALFAGLKKSKEGGLVYPGRDACPADRLKFVALQLVPDARGDLVRAQVQLDWAMSSLKQDGGNPGLLGVAQFLQSQLVERRRYEELQVQLKEQQRRADDLSAKLDALRQIEQAMTNKAIHKKGKP